MAELKKLNVDGAVVKPPEDAQATYKTIPETDTEYKEVQNSNMVKENGDNCVDGADEKMLAEDEKKLSPKGDLADVKFVTADHQNGDAKIDIVVIKQGFTGLTKEELLKFSNDPFWVRLRWIMFVGFWLLWLGMLAGAIVIIIGAPKCAPPPPKTWWQEGPLLESDPLNSELDALDYKSVESKLPILSQLKIKGLFVPATPGEDDYAAVIPTPTDVSEFKRLAESAKEKNIRIVVDLTPNYVSKNSEWFTRSEKREEPYTNYFVWADSKKFANEEPQPPNTWRSVDSEISAWSYSGLRKQYYLHQFNESTPDLNFRNQDVIDEFSKVIKFWISNGANGVRLSKVKYLLVDQSLGNESISSSSASRGKVLGEYGFYEHAKTTYQPGLVDVLSKWKAVVLNATDGQGLLMLKENLEESGIESLSSNGTMIVDLPRYSRALNKPSTEYVAKNLQQSLQNVFAQLGDEAWPSWKYHSEDGALSSELAIISMLLPGVPVVSLDQLLVTADNKTDINAQYSSLANMRSQPSMTYGGYSSYLLANDTVFAFSRLKSGNPGVLVLFNPGPTAAVTNITSIPEMPSEVRVSLLSKNYNEPNVAVNGNLQSNNVTVSAKSIIIVTYVPLKKE